jgi:4-hydroxybenzoate polyprenyltransferase
LSSHFQLVNAPIKNYFSLIKFSHTVFALPFAIIGFFLALRQTGKSFEWMLFMRVLICMVLARTAAMAYNRYADRDIDSLNERTKTREIPAGIVSPHSALLLVIVSCLLFVFTTWFINPLCFYLSPVVLLVILGYSITKRFTYLCHLVLGVGLALAPIAAYLAVTGAFAWLPLLFSFIVLCWVSGFDIIYALQDEDFDRSNQLFSIPARVGKKKALMISNILHLFCAVFLVTAGYAGTFGAWYWCGCAFFIFLLYYQHRLVRPDDLSKVNIAFFTTNGIASIVFAAFVLADLFLIPS